MDPCSPLKEGFQLPVSYQSWEMKEMQIYVSVFEHESNNISVKPSYTMLLQIEKNILLSGGW